MTLETLEILPLDSSRRRVVVVDDDPILRELMSGQLSTLGWDVSTEVNGQAGADCLTRIDADLAVIDISMPELDGFGLLQLLRQNPRTADLPVIVCTSHNDAEAIERAYRLGASSFVSKPINWPQFLHHAQFVMRNGETERALRAAKIEAQSASRTKSAMFQVLTHELKTPLTALIGLTSLIDRQLRGQCDAQVTQQMEHVVDASQRLNGIVSDIMLLAKAVAGNQQQNFEAARLDEILDDSLSGLKAKAARLRVRLLVQPLKQPVDLLCDVRLLRQAVTKLVDNAIRFSPEGGAVDLWGHVSANGSITISVKDQGPGLSPQKLKECLQPFTQENMSYSRPADGMGLGLPIAKAICEAHGGELLIQTAVGHGLLANIELPASLHLRQVERLHG